MKYLKLLGINLSIMFLILFICTFIITLLNYFNIISGNTMSILKILIIILTMLIGGFLTGKKSKEKGWLEGIKIGSIFSIILILINLLFIKNFEFKNIIYYLILIIASVLGSMVGISKKAS